MGMESQRGVRRGDATWVRGGVVRGTRVGHPVSGGHGESELHGAKGANEGLWIPLPWPRCPGLLLRWQSTRKRQRRQRRREWQPHQRCSEGVQQSRRDRWHGRARSHGGSSSRAITETVVEQRSWVGPSWSRVVAKRRGSMRGRWTTRPDGTGGQRADGQRGSSSTWKEEGGALSGS
jgi:hypothetical protein